MLILDYAVAGVKYLVAVLLALAIPAYLFQDSLTAGLAVMIVGLWLAARYGKRQFARVS